MKEIVGRFSSVPIRRVGAWAAPVLVVVLGFGCEFGPWSHGTRPKPSARNPEDKESPSSSRSGKARGQKVGEGAKVLNMRRGKAGETGQMHPAAVSVVPRKSPSSPSKAVGSLSTGILADGSPWIGGKDAKVVIEEFSDFGCPFCRMGAKVMQELLEHFGQRIKVVFRQMPITALHPDSFLAAEASLAAAAQGKFWAMHDLLFSHPHAHSMQDLMGYAQKLGLDTARFRRDLEQHRLKEKVEADRRAGVDRGVQGTPTFFVTGRGKVEGYLPFGDFRKIVEDQLSER